ncbi:ParB/RepB/Spo0J family partition protein [Pseudomonas aeruginosa]|uniref:ParB/RepB/Spo0J family partition protein n=1 Tax=Pseudomonas aeruginosa TaxID=287 RepID=UPI000E67B5E0|nr:ParB/RepB/Spo0J family partition protein [Pseudomonas aeruginosa]MBA5107690.1 ParB/RepB/Spo0J family partition protein [Pseudomonas aeruginosa]MBD1300141.1 ParB/RepB/Spo0J family partition protein [Pseudomonas aeruginosa]MBD1340706.1 ParB/RepB/Spo0J family partition protein [Pseudomonas aeruginosa]MBG4604279.1 ParB/RepB/Spo0J family partition protein [Pseudomonas aeruginosa]MBH3592846.1 ParB/RepB/Spo0J family partition protein [Pseudomonas aeruginosa]
MTQKKKLTPSKEQPGAAPAKPVRRANPLAGALKSINQEYREGNSNAGGLVDSEPQVAKQISMGLIDPSPYQPRVIFDDKKIEELAASIDKNGLMSPITVRPVNNRYELIAGERRFRAHQIMKKTVIKAFVINITDEEASTRALADNRDAEPLTEFETYLAIRNHRNTFGGNHDYEYWGFTKSAYFRLLAFDSLPQAAIELLKRKPALITGYAADEYKKMVNAEVEKGGSKEKLDQAAKNVIQKAVDSGVKINNLAGQVFKQLNPTQVAPNKTPLKYSGGTAGEITKKATFTQIKLNRSAFSDEKLAKLETYLSQLLAE